MLTIIRKKAFNCGDMSTQMHLIVEIFLSFSVARASKSGQKTSQNQQNLRHQGPATTEGARRDHRGARLDHRGGAPKLATDIQIQIFCFGRWKKF